MTDYAFDNRILAWACSLAHRHCQVQIIPPIICTVCYSSAHYVRVVTISCSVIGQYQCATDGGDALVERQTASPVMFETS